MGRYKNPYSVYKRTDTGYYYFQTYDKNGRRTSPKSTGKTNEISARAYCDKLIRDGKMGTDAGMTFSRYADPWWIWDSCPYVVKKARRDEHGDGLSQDYVTKNRATMIKWVIPHFGRVKLEDIDSEIVDSWLFAMTAENAKDKISYKYANNVLGILSVMLSEAVRRRLIPYNPCASVPRLKAKKKVRELYTGPEICELFTASLWGGVTPGYLVNLTAAVTGLRWGEIRALLSEDYHGDHFDVKASLNNSNVRGRVKTREERLAPVPNKLQKLLDEFGKEPFLFGGVKPIGLHVGMDDLKAALTKLEIDHEARGLTFHAWRHFFNTYMRSIGVPTSKVQAVTGHKTGDMTDHYTSFRAEDYAEILAAQNRLLS